MDVRTETALRSGSASGKSAKGLKRKRQEKSRKDIIESYNKRAKKIRKIWETKTFLEEGETDFYGMHEAYADVFAGETGRAELKQIKIMEKAEEDMENVENGFEQARRETVDTIDKSIRDAFTRLRANGGRPNLAHHFLVGRDPEQGAEELEIYRSEFEIEHNATRPLQLGEEEAEQDIWAPYLRAAVIVNIVDGGSPPTHSTPLATQKNQAGPGITAYTMTYTSQLHGNDGVLSSNRLLSSNPFVGGGSNIFDPRKQLGPPKWCRPSHVSIFPTTGILQSGQSFVSAIRAHQEGHPTRPGQTKRISAVHKEWMIDLLEFGNGSGSQEKKGPPVLRGGLWDLLADLDPTVMEGTALEDAIYRSAEHRIDLIELMDSSIWRIVAPGVIQPKAYSALAMPKSMTNTEIAAYYRRRSETVAERIDFDIVDGLPKQHILAIHPLGRLVRDDKGYFIMAGHGPLRPDTARPPQEDVEETPERSEVPTLKERKQPLEPRSDTRKHLPAVPVSDDLPAHMIVDETVALLTLTRNEESSMQAGEEDRIAITLRTNSIPNDFYVDLLPPNDEHLEAGPPRSVSAKRLANGDRQRKATHTAAAAAVELDDDNVSVSSSADCVKVNLLQSVSNTVPEAMPSCQRRFLGRHRP